MHFSASMNSIRVFALAAGFCFLTGTAGAEPACSAHVRANVEVESGEFSLANLLTSGTCSELLRAAALIHLGRAPLAGSVRVFTGEEVRDLLRQALTRVQPVHEALGNAAASARPLPVQMFERFRIPERVIVRRAGSRASCAQIGQEFLTPPETHPGPSSPTGSEPLSSLGIDCGAADRIAQGSALVSQRTVWNAALASWEVSLRCLHPGDCVPFLLRLPGGSAVPQIASLAHSFAPGSANSIAANSTAEAAAAKRLASQPLVRPGEKVLLLWDEGGIRLRVPAVCLDAGGDGQTVRARIVSSGRTVTAIVLRAGVLGAGVLGAGESRTAS